MVSTELPIGLLPALLRFATAYGVIAATFS